MATEGTHDFTHFVCPEFHRTENLLVALAAGRPVVSPQWVRASAAEHTWLNTREHLIQVRALSARCRGAKNGPHPKGRVWSLLTPEHYERRDAFLRNNVCHLLFHMRLFRTRWPCRAASGRLEHLSPWKCHPLTGGHPTIRYDDTTIRSTGG